MEQGKRETFRSNREGTGEREGGRIYGAKGRTAGRAGESGQAEDKDVSLSCYQDIQVKTPFRQLEIIIKVKAAAIAHMCTDFVVNEAF